MKILANISYGRQLVEMTLAEMTCRLESQRDIRYNQINEINRTGFKGAFFGIPHVTQDGHIVEGHTRYGLMTSKTVNGCYVAAHSDIIPKGKRVGDLCIMECIMLPKGSDESEAFITMAAATPIKNIQRFKVQVNAKVGGKVQKDIVKLLTKYGVRVQYNTNMVKANNTTKNPHDLEYYYKASPKVVESTIRILSTVYRHPADTGVYEKEALTRVFLEAMCQFVQHHGFDDKTIITATRIAWQTGLTANTIMGLHQCVGSGSGPKIAKIRAILAEILDIYLNGRNMTDIYGYIPAV